MLLIQLAVAHACDEAAGELLAQASVEAICLTRGGTILHYLFTSKSGKMVLSVSCPKQIKASDRLNMVISLHFFLCVISVQLK